MAYDRKVTFIPEGVMVKLDSEAKEYFVERTLPPSEDLPETPDVFKPLRRRPVITIGLFTRKTPLDEHEISFPSAIELWVPYTDADVESADGKPLKLAYHAGNKWVVFTKEAHDFKLIPEKHDDRAGYGVARISEWKDPPIAWGT